MPSQRIEQILAARATGKTLAEIGAEFGVSRARIGQILSKHGGPSGSEVRETRRAAEEEKDNQISNRIGVYLHEHGAQYVDKVAKALSLDSQEVSRLWPRELSNLKLRLKVSGEPYWTDDRIFDALRSAALYDFPLTTSAYRELVRVGQIHGPSIPRIYQRFGTWVAACSAAGVESGRSRRDNYQSRWTDEELLAYARQYFLDGSTTGSAHGYDPWRRRQDEEMPSGMTIRNRLGTWLAIREKALRVGPAQRGTVHVGD